MIYGVSGEHLNTDAEIVSIAEDRLQRAPFVRRIAERISRAGADRSVVFGLAGPWGSGKSSVLNMISEVLSTEHGDQWSVVSFTPWSASSVAELTEEFYAAVASAMPDTEAGHHARKALRAAVPVAVAVGKAGVAALFDRHFGDGATAKILTAGSDKLAEQAGHLPAPVTDPFSQRFEAASQAISAAGRNVLVVVDDVDRLHADELLAVMKAVRLLGRFDRVHYLLSYDEQTVLDVLVDTDLARHNPRRASRYLEKIVQYPFVLPPIQHQHLSAELQREIRELVDIHDLGAARPGIDTAQEAATVCEILLDTLPTDTVTLRSLKRLCSQVDVLLTLVGSREIDLLDAFVLTYLRLEHRALYAMLPHWRSELTRSPQTAARLGGVSSDWYQRIEDVTGFAVGDREARTIYRLLATVFPALPIGPDTVMPPRARATSLRAHNGGYFDRYFAFRVPVDDIEDHRAHSALAELARTGRLPTMLTEWLPDENRRRLLRDKLLANLDAIAGAPPAQAAQAATALTEAVPVDHADLYFTRWGTVIHALLAHAITELGPADAAALIDDYRARFGLATTLDVLAVPTAVSGVPVASVLVATTAVRREVFELCVRDLTTDIPNDEQAPHASVLGVAHYLDDQLWGDLRTRVGELQNSGVCDILDVAARFVSISTRLDPSGNGGHRQRYLSRFESTLFGRLIDSDQWRTLNLPQPSNIAIDDNDLSMSNRREYAIGALRQLQVTGQYTGY
ncbi:hypothetical protein GFY24_39500 [Nocardia sp. SYP-A9097]|nr:hypothetical protein [Nocardia sp. SYP-A9097]